MDAIKLICLFSPFAKLVRAMLMIFQAIALSAMLNYLEIELAHIMGRNRYIQ